MVKNFEERSPNGYFRVKNPFTDVFLFEMLELLLWQKKKSEWYGLK